MTWKNLWIDARAAAASGSLERAADLFTRSLFEAQRVMETNDPEFLKERNEFYQRYKSHTQSFPKVQAPAKPGHSPQHTCEVEPVDEWAVWRLCSLCGKSSQLCGCRSLPYVEMDEKSAFEPGDMIAGKYQIVRILGTGGMALVYLVRDQADKLFAMKILNKGCGDEGQAAERFEREARLISKMRHPNIVSVFGFGKMSDGRSYFVMEFVKGDSLLSVLESEVRMSMKRTCNIILQVCDAMAHAHEMGVVHRDLKPSNVILLSDREESDLVKIVDFGIAKLNLPWEGMESRLTQDGQVLGSPAYMSPEQCLGGEIDHRSDIYSVGCVMYQLLCGVPPFWGEHAMAILYKQVNTTPPTLPLSLETISPSLEKVVLKTLCKDPNDRYQSMSDLESELVRLMIDQREVKS